MSTPKQTRHSFPKANAFIEDVSRAYQKVGTVRSKVNFSSADPDWDESTLCRNYYNKAVSDLLKVAREKGADAVIEVRSVVFYEDGKSSLFKTPECSDDGQEGQVLAQGLAVKWIEPGSSGKP